MNNYFTNLGIEKPTEIQNSYCPSETNFSILIANTGSGKTLCFLIKLALFLEKNPKEQVLILAPTRELAKQVYDVLTKLRLNYSSIICYGGHSFKNEELQFSQYPQIVVGTPGRILDHYERNTKGLSNFSAVIIDEYDKTLEFGFLNELEAIFRFSRSLKHIQLISATEISELPNFIQSSEFKTFDFLENIKPKLTFYSVEAEENDKLKCLALLLTSFEDEPIIVFCTHREATERLSKHLFEYGKENVLFHGGLEQFDRERALMKFKNSSVNCLIATDLASRGLDIPDIQHIIHYQFPSGLEDFTHRNGRTARMHKSGKVYLIHSQNEPLPSYLSDFKPDKLTYPNTFKDYKEAKNVTLYVNIGRKQKIRKMDIVGYLTNDLKIPFDKIGLIHVADNYSYLALEKETYSTIKQNFSQSIKIKKTNAKINLCR
jgi:superfamily II DNA/RNA helicase